MLRGRGAGGDDDVAGADAGCLAVGAGNVNGVGGGDASGSRDMLDVVFAEQEGDAASHAVNDLAAALDGDGVVGVEVVEGEAELVGALDVGDNLGVFEQGLGRDTAPVEAKRRRGPLFR